MTARRRSRSSSLPLNDSTDQTHPAAPARGVRVATLVLCALAVLAAARGLVRHNTWYLASDQFAFLTFADDLARGGIFHDPTTIELLAGPLLPRDAAADAYYQTYIYDQGRLYSRYPPGYPLLLAAAGLVGGETARHWLNPLLYLVLVAVLGRLAAGLAPRAPGATAAATMWALLVIPVEVHYWGITVARDLPAHLLALVAILCALSRAPGWAGLLLGLAAGIRPDAVLWGPSIGLVLPRDVGRARALARGTSAFLLGVLPLFAYNTVTRGHPLAFTQGGEFSRTFETGLLLPSTTLLAAVSFVSGGAFRIANFPTTFPAHVFYLAGAFGAFLWLALAMLVAGTVRRAPIARALGPYVVIGLLFYSCWSHGDPRYLVGVSLSLIVLAATALVSIAAWLAEPGTSPRARLLGAVAVAGVLGLGGHLGGLLPRDPARGLTSLERASALAVAAAAAAGFVPGVRALAPLAPALAFAVFGAARMVASDGTTSAFTGADVARARTAIESVVPPDAIVLMSGGLGRPAENWTRYTHAHAHYVNELGRLFADANYACFRATNARRPFYVLIGATERLPFTAPPGWVRTREVARRDGTALREWFVDHQRAPAGVVLYEATFVIPRVP